MKLLRAAQTHAFVVSMMLCCVPVSLRALEEPVAPSVAAIETWISQLGSDDFDARKEASIKLAELGDAARAALEKALASSDSETRAAAKRLLIVREQASLRCMAFNRDGKPIPGIEGSVTMWDSSDPYQTTRTNPPLTFGPNGEANIPNLKLGSCSFNFQFQKCWQSGTLYGNENYYNAAVSVRAGQTPFLFTMSKGGSVKCNIRDKAGKPVKDAEFSLYNATHFDPDMIELRDENHSSPAQFTGSTDAKGEVLIETVNDGVYVCVASSGDGTYFPGPMIRVREGKTTLAPAMDIVVAPRGKIVFSPRGIIDEQNKEEIDQAREMAQQNRGGKPAEKKKEEPKKDPKTPAVADVLKDLKITVEEEYLYEGPDAERKQRKISAEKARYNRYRQRPTFETDETGKITIDNLRAGKHRVVIQCPGFAPKTMTVEIPPSGTADLGALVFEPGGGVAFKAVTSDNKPVTDLVVYPIPEEESILNDVSQDVLDYIRGQTTWSDVRNYLQYRQQMNRRNQNNNTANKDKTMVNHLATGTYSLLVFRQSSAKIQQVFLICGVKVEAGKTTEIANVVFAAVPSTVRVNDGSTIKGKIIGASGEFLNRCYVYYQAQNGGSTGTSMSEDGTFNLHMGGMTPGGTIRVKVPGYKQAEFDCSAPGVDLTKVEIKLEKLVYGDVRIRVVDEAGQPLSGVNVEPKIVTSQNYYYSGNQRSKKRKILTDEKGVVRLTGLSAGLRRILLMKDGYYLADPIRVVVRAETEVVVDVMMRKGLSISGTLIAPAGTPFSNAVVNLRRAKDSALIASSPDASGRFSIGGLAPGKYSISAEAPMLLAKVIQDLELIGESKDGLDLKLEKRGGFVAQFDPSLKGRTAWLADKETFEQGMTINRRVLPKTSFNSYAVVDAEGRAEFWGVPAGSFRMSFSPDYNRATLPVEKNGAKYVSHVDCNGYSDVFEIADPKSFSELKIEDAYRIKFPEATASALVKFAFNKNSKDTATRSINFQSTVYVTVRGQQCSGQFNSSTQRVRSISSTTVTDKLRVIGTLPAFLAPAKSTLGQTLIQNLVAGKYTVVVSSWNYDSMRGMNEQTEEVVAAEFEVKAGEFKDLGTIGIEPSKKVTRNVVSRSPYSTDDIDPPTDEDADPIFEP
ncbi:MAG: carboxypeptidase regulatory-like domain-containing protein [Planctomycetota bacterium]